MKKITFLLFMALLLSATFTQAQDIINPISATAMLVDFGEPIDTVNGEGLSEFPSTTASHASSVTENSLMWFNGSNVIDFDLGGNFTVEGLAYWNGTSDTSDYGVRDVIISSSIDGVNFTPITGAPTEFAEATLPPNLAETFAFDAVNTAHIRIEALNNHGNFLLTIFSEIAFIGTAEPTENVINPISATTTLSAQFGSSLDNTINGVGLDVFPTLSGTHEGTSPGNSFLATNDTGSIDFDLGGSFLVDGLAFWNENAPGPGQTGIQDVVISSSEDGVTYTPIAGAPTSFAQVMSPTSAAEQFSFTEITASFIRFDVLSNYGDPGNLVAFAEVAFSGVSTLGVSDSVLADALRLYPNPAKDVITISNNSNIELEGIAIYDMNGRLVKQIETIDNSRNQTINISELTYGIYLIRIYNNQANTVKRVIKN
jgi:hypothetical protein